MFDSVGDVLSRIERPEAPDPAFAEQLFEKLSAQLDDEGPSGLVEPSGAVSRLTVLPFTARRFRPNRVQLVAAAAVLAAAAVIGAVLLPAQSAHPNPHVAAPVPRSTTGAPSPAGDVGPAATGMAEKAHGRSRMHHGATGDRGTRFQGETPGAQDKIAFASDRDTGGHGRFQIYTMNADGTGVRRVTHDDGNDRQPSWSPDGKRIVFTRAGVTDVDPSHVYIVNADGTGLQHLAAGRGPEFSPDGSIIAFYQQANDGGLGPDWINPLGGICGPWAIWTIKPDGSDLRFVFNDGADPTWSPDGSRLSFGSTRHRDSNHALMVNVFSARIDGTDVLQLTRDLVLACLPDWSPDGRRIAHVTYVTDDLGTRFQIGVVHSDGTDDHVVRHDDAANIGPSWSPDGRTIVYERDPDGDFQYLLINTGPAYHGIGELPSSIWMMTADGSSAWPVSKVTSYSDVDPSFAS